ncbi:phage tail protein [Photobacterium swingsii]|uniref:phage tail protein n=1 Tax=Photobacterium swingsii TaxID=680026 RepID=UPI003D0F3A5C
MDKIKFKRATVGGYVPTAAQVDEGELVINLTDKKIFTKDHHGQVISIGGGGGGSPVGTIAVFPKEPISAGYLKCDGTKYDKNVYRALFAYLGTDVTPNYTARYLKGTSSSLAAGVAAGWMIPEHTHNVAINHSHGASFRGNQLPNHNHSGNVGTGGNSFEHDQGNGRLPATSWSRTTGSASAGTPSGSVTVNTHNETKISTGIRESFRKGSGLDVDHVGVIFAIKAGEVNEITEVVGSNHAGELTVGGNINANGHLTVKGQLEADQCAVGNLQCADLDINGELTINGDPIENTLNKYSEWQYAEVYGWASPASNRAEALKWKLLDKDTIVVRGIVRCNPINVHGKIAFRFPDDIKARLLGAQHSPAVQGNNNYVFTEVSGASGEMFIYSGGGSTSWVMIHQTICLDQR